MARVIAQTLRVSASSSKASLNYLAVLHADHGELRPLSGHFVQADVGVVRYPSFRQRARDVAKYSRAKVRLSTVGTMGDVGSQVG